MVMRRVFRRPEIRSQQPRSGERVQPTAQAVGGRMHATTSPRGRQKTHPVECVEPACRRVRRATVLGYAMFFSRLLKVYVVDRLILDVLAQDGEVVAIVESTLFHARKEMRRNLSADQAPRVICRLVWLLSPLRGSRHLPPIHPRLAPWAAFFRSFGAWNLP